MTLKLILAVTLIAVAPTVAFAQKDDPVDQAPKPTVEEAQKLVQTISSDKTKLQVYCEIGNLQKQMEKAQEDNNTKALDAPFAKLDSLEQQVGPEYARMMDGLGEVDPSSAEGQKFTAIFDPLHKQCK